MSPKSAIVSLVVFTFMFPFSANCEDKCESVCCTLEPSNIQFDYQEDQFDSQVKSLEVKLQVKDIPDPPVKAFFKPEDVVYSRSKIPEMDIVVVLNNHCLYFLLVHTD
ncbi:secreted protein, partial [Candidatus Magnetomorum sp. HK-1]